MKVVIGIALGVALNAMLALMGRGHFLFDVFTLAACVWVAAPLFIFSGIFLAIAYRKSHPMMVAIGQWIMLASLVLGSSLASIYFGGMLNRRDIDRAKAYCEQLATEVDRAREANGFYPTNLTEIVDQSTLPRILRGGNLYYHSQGTNYSITFANPGGLMDGWDFIGSTKTWSRFN